MPKEAVSYPPEEVSMDADSVRTFARYSARARHDLGRKLKMRNVVRSFTTDLAEYYVTDGLRQAHAQGIKSARELQKVAQGLRDGHDIVIMPGVKDADTGNEEHVVFIAPADPLHKQDSKPIQLSLTPVETRMLLTAALPSLPKDAPHAKHEQLDQNIFDREKLITALDKRNPVILSTAK